MRTALSLTLCVTLLALNACDEAKEAAPLADASEKFTAESTPSSSRLDQDRSTGVAYTRVEGTPGTGALDADIKPDARKIIYSASVSLVVDDFEGVPAKVSALVQQHGGFVARSNVRGSADEPRVGEWTLRVPSGRYDQFVAGAQALGQLREITSDSREVTAEYVDLEARVRNLTAEEARLHQHLDKSTHSLKDILEVEREIARVRGEAERIQGRLNVLKDLTALSTVTVLIEEIKDYVPTPTEEPGYTTQAGRAWSASVDSVGEFLTGLSLFLVRLTPWLVVIVPVGMVALFITKRARKQSKRITPAPVSTSA